MPKTTTYEKETREVATTWCDRVRANPFASYPQLDAIEKEYDQYMQRQELAALDSIERHKKYLAYKGAVRLKKVGQYYTVIVLRKEGGIALAGLQDMLDAIGLRSYIRERQHDAEAESLQQAALRA